MSLPLSQLSLVSSGTREQEFRSANTKVDFAQMVYFATVHGVCVSHSCLICLV